MMTSQEMVILGAKLEDDVILGIHAVIDGTIEKYVNPFVSLGTVIAICEDVFGKNFENHDMDSNGWECDMWVNVKIDCKEYVISAEGYYGGIEFYKTKWS